MSRPGCQERFAVFAFVDGRAAPARYTQPQKPKLPHRAPMPTASIDTPDIPATVQIEQTHLRLPSRPDWITAAVEYIKTRAILAGACQESRAARLVVALHEAFSNAIIHGNLEVSSDPKERGDSSFAEALAQKMTDPILGARHVDVLIDYDGQRCRWIITDEGKGFDVDRALAKTGQDDAELLLASGRGILIMRSFVDDVRYELGGRRVILTLLRASGAEKRRHERLDYQQPLRIVPVREDGSVDWDAAYEAVSRNISQEGLNILQEQLAGTRRIMIGLPAGNRLIYIPAEIRHCQTLTGGIVEIGCRFESTDPGAGATAGAPPSQAVEAVHQAVDALLEKAQLASAVHDERRAHPRVAYHGRVEIRAEGAEPLVGFVRNLSRGGIAFLTTVPLPCEERVIVLPQAHGPALGLRCRVVRSIKVKEGLYDIGASFLALSERSV
jgi:anti-sigma regulatory factor (Ser/Thr protein kinase)